MMAHDFRTKQKKTNEHPPVNDRRVVFRSSVGSSYLGLYSARPHGAHLSAKSAEAAARLGSQATLRSQNMGRCTKARFRKDAKATSRPRLSCWSHSRLPSLVKWVKCRFARMLKGKTGLLDPARNWFFRFVVLSALRCWCFCRSQVWLRGVFLSRVQVFVVASARCSPSSLSTSSASGSGRKCWSAAPCCTLLSTTQFQQESHFLGV